MELNQQLIIPEQEVNSAASFLDWSKEYMTNREKVKSEITEQKLQQARSFLEQDAQENHELLVKEYPELGWIKFTVKDDFEVNYDNGSFKPKIKGSSRYECQLSDTVFVSVKKEQDHNGIVFSFRPFLKKGEEMPYWGQTVCLSLPRKGKEINSFYAELAISINKIEPDDIPF